MEIELTSEYELMVEQRIQTGQYASASDVVSEALHFMERYDVCMAQYSGGNPTEDCRRQSVATS